MLSFMLMRKELPQLTRQGLLGMQGCDWSLDSEEGRYEPRHHSVHPGLQWQSAERAAIGGLGCGHAAGGPTRSLGCGCTPHLGPPWAIWRIRGRLARIRCRGVRDVSIGNGSAGPPAASSPAGDNSTRADPRLCPSHKSCLGFCKWKYPTSC